eukprot:jgi/Mesvir1/4950/Mv04572-RA.1
MLGDMNLTLTLEALAPYGIVLMTEERAALDNALALKAAEVGIPELKLWGKIKTSKGRDYMVAMGISQAYYYNKQVTLKRKFFYSMDAVKWHLLPPVSSAEILEKCPMLQGPFTGDAGHVYVVEEPLPADQMPPLNEDGTPQEDEDGNPLPTTKQINIPELDRLSYVITSIEAETCVVPAGAMVLTAKNDIVPNRSFTGLSYPQKLESYIHIMTGPNGTSLTEDIRGAWSLQHDSFKQQTILQSLLWPGYVFYFSNLNKTYGALYLGDGLKNNDLAFMI